MCVYTGVPASTSVQGWALQLGGVVVLSVIQQQHTMLTLFLPDPLPSVASLASRAAKAFSRFSSSFSRLSRSLDVLFALACRRVMRYRLSAASHTAVPAEKWS